MFRGILTLLLLAACSSGETIQVTSYTHEGDVTMGATVEKKEGWQQSGTLTTGDANKKVSMQAEFPKPGYYTFQFGVIPAKSGAFRAVAEVQFSVEGSTVRRRVTIGNGTSISGTGQAAKVTVSDDSANFLGFLGNDYTVWAQCSPGTRPSQNQPPVLQGDLVRVNAGTQSVVPIPDNAGVISLELVAAPLATASGLPVNSLIGVLSNPVGFTLKTFAITGNPGFISVPAGATILTVQNVSTADDYLVTPTWGIDG